MKLKRPWGISVYGCIVIVMACVNLLVYITFIHNNFARFLILSFNIVYILIGTGLLLLKEWARKSFLLASYFSIIACLLVLFYLRNFCSATYFLILAMAIYSFGIYFFSHKNIKYVFSESKKVTQLT